MIEDAGPAPVLRALDADGCAEGDVAAELGRCCLQINGRGETDSLVGAPLGELAIAGPGVFTFTDITTQVKDWYQNDTNNIIIKEYYY